MEIKVKTWQVINGLSVALPHQQYSINISKNPQIHGVKPTWLPIVFDTPVYLSEQQANYFWGQRSCELRLESCGKRPEPKL